MSTTQEVVDHQCPPHMKGVRTKRKHRDNAGIPFDYLHNGARMTSFGIKKARKDNATQLMKSKKLALILDLDQTLLHTIMTQDITYDQDQHLVKLAKNPRHCLYRFDDMWTKLRPSVHQFLKEASGMFDMYVYTMGCRDYAHKMVKLLDPEGVYFKSKIICREDTSIPMHKGLDKVLTDEKLVLILDDTKEVWKGHDRNLITIDKYNFFGNTTVDESRKDGVLVKTLLFLKVVHQLFFDPEMKKIFPSQDTRDVLEKINRIVAQKRKLLEKLNGERTRKEASHCSPTMLPMHLRLPDPRRILC